MNKYCRLLTILLLVSCSRTLVLEDGTEIELTSEQESQLKIEWERVGRTGKVQKKGYENCSYYGYCYGCGLDFHGELSCGFRSQTCSGRMEVAYTEWYESWQPVYHVDDWTGLGLIEDKYMKEYSYRGHCN